MQTARFSPSRAIFSALLLAWGACFAGAQVFRDVPKGHWAKMEAEWLRSRGYIEGWGGKLHGDKQFTRYEMVELFYRFLKKTEAKQRHYDTELAALKLADRRIEKRLDSLFQTAGNQGSIETPAEMRRYRAEKTVERIGSTGTIEARDSGVVARLRDLHQRVSGYRREGLTSPVLVVPPGSSVLVSLPEVLMDDQPARFDEGVHVIHWDAHLNVPAGSSASLLFPGEKGGVVLLEESAGTVRQRGYVADPGTPAPVAVEDGRGS